MGWLLTEGVCRQFAQQRLKKGAVVGGWVSSFYLLLPACLTPFLGIYIDVYGQRIGFRTSPLCLCGLFMIDKPIEQSLPPVLLSWSPCSSSSFRTRCLPSVCPHPLVFML